jgi:hypothetical protein
VASNIYQCGREKAPVATSAIQTSIIADAVAAAPVITNMNSENSKYFIDCYTKSLKIFHVEMVEIHFLIFAP